mmetsp:Transcript_16648/g.38437  ORF Transcript_16648/g.38437 Transcript_16648/m.38437 type:complete len:83 (-) Transcript_16648:336-584(-)
MPQNKETKDNKMPCSDPAAASKSRRHPPNRPMIDSCVVCLRKIVPSMHNKSRKKLTKRKPEGNNNRYPDSAVMSSVWQYQPI